MRHSLAARPEAHTGVEVSPIGNETSFYTRYLAQRVTREGTEHIRRVRVGYVIPLSWEL
jgi:hypothetical protein